MIIEFHKQEVIDIKQLPDPNILNKNINDIANDTLRWIELCGRTAYKSHHKLGPTSHIDFVKRMLKLGHESVIEHSNLIISLKDRSLHNLWRDYVFESPHNSSFHYWVRDNKDSNILYINGNWRAWRQTFKYISASYFDSNMRELIATITHALINEYNFTDLLDDVVSKSYYTALASHNMRQSVDIFPSNAPISLYRISCRIKTNRLITHELVRHRPRAAYTQESTRYCVYLDPNDRTKSKFNLIESELSYDKELDCHDPDYISAINRCGKVYANAIDNGISREYARGILPHDIAAEIAVTHDIGTVNTFGWKYIMKLRSSKAAAPQIRQLCDQINDMSNKYLGINLKERL